MFKLYKLYRKSQEVQYAWIRKHPVQWITLNAILLAAWIGYLEYRDRQEMRKLELDIAQQNK